VSRPLEAGDVFAGYRIEAVLGRGGMGVVYRAEDLHLGRTVALKVLAPERASDPGFRDRFLRESKLLASIDHRNIVDVFHADEVDGQLFLVMRFIDGFDLGTLLAREGRLQARVVAHVIREAGEALDEAHSHGLVHRDVKPGNVLIAPRGRPLHEARVYLSDFGLTKRADGQSQLTTAGQFLGTPAYVAPEQIQGSTVDGRADLYALACVAFECLAGNSPFHEAGDAAVLMAHLIAPPPDLAAVRPDLPADVARVVRRGMAKSRDQRPDTCAAFAVALQEALAPASAAEAAAAQAGAVPTPTPGGQPATIGVAPPPVDAAPTPSAAAATEPRNRARDAEATVLVTPGAAPVAPARAHAPAAPPVAPVPQTPPAEPVPPAAGPAPPATPRSPVASPAPLAQPPIGQSPLPPQPTIASPAPAAVPPGAFPEPASSPPRAFAAPTVAAPTGRTAAGERAPRNRALVAVAAGIAGLAVVGGAFAFGLFGRVATSPAPTGTTAAATANATLAAGTAVAATATPAADRPFPDANEERLLNMVPELVKASCQRAPPEVFEAFGPVAMVECRPTGHLAPSLVRYALYGSDAAIDAAYSDRLAVAMDIANLRNEPTRCTMSPHAGGYGDYAHFSTPGRMICYVDAEGRAVFSWSVKVLRVMSEAIRDDGNSQQLHLWWSDPQRSGPLG
jgi:hypothetical protein